LQAYLDAINVEFRRYKRLADGAIRQVTEDELFAVPAPGANSIAVLVKHVGGNLKSRWTDFLTSDGEKPDRHRDGEFVVTGSDEWDAVQALWEVGWSRALETVSSLQTEDLDGTVTVRGEAHGVVQAIERSLAHTAYHVGQIVQLAKQLAGDRWQTLSIPLGGSEAFNADMRTRFGEAGPAASP